MSILKAILHVAPPMVNTETTTTVLLVGEKTVNQSGPFDVVLSLIAISVYKMHVCRCG